MLKNVSLLCIVFISFTFLTAQEIQTFGILTNADKKLTNYPKDSTANAVVLFEKGDNYFEAIDGSIKIVKKYYIKIKILKKEGLRQANISIPLYKGDRVYEEIVDIKAITHNGESQTRLSKNNIFTSDINERWSVKKFAFPNVNIGCIIEYEYKLISPFIFNFQGWTFQSEIPKLYSEFNAKIPGNYFYNRSLVGFLKLTVNESSIEKDCFHIEGYPASADCEILKYAIKDIPAFKDEEGYMLTSKNYISRLDFELSEYMGLDGRKKRYTNSWDDVDREFKQDKDIGGQLTKKSFLKNNVPDSILTQGDKITRAKNIYNFVKNRFTWNGDYGIYKGIRVKSAFDDRIGNIGEINISLINLLNTADIKTDLVLLSTRQNGLPKKAHPVMSDFNYVIAKTEINGKTYLLDASEKLMPFGMLPYRCLNYQGRVMDFKNDSYWYDIVPEKNNQTFVIAELNLNSDSSNITGSIKEMNNGYMAIHRKAIIQDLSEEDYLAKKEDLIGNDFEIDAYILSKEQSNEMRTVEDFNFSKSYTQENNIIYLNPFLVKFFDKNPFTLEERNYPVDFGYARKYLYSVNIALPNDFTVAELPKKKNVTLPNNGGDLQLNFTHKPRSITLIFKLNLNNTHYSVDSYFALKELFKLVTTIQNNLLIVLKKK